MSEQSSPMTDMAEQAFKQYQEALHTGFSFQEAATNWWSTLLTPTAAVPEWPQRFGNLMALSNNVLPQAQKRMEEMMDFLQQNSRSGSQLMQQAVAAAQTLNPVESQAKWMEFWMTSLAVLQFNAQAATRFNAQALETWLGLTRTATTHAWNPKSA